MIVVTFTYVLLCTLTLGMICEGKINRKCPNCGKRFDATSES